MRMFIVNLLAATLVAFSASSAGAISLTLAGANGQTLNQGDQFSVTVTLDTEGLTGITLLSIGVIFDDTRLSYNQALSSSTSYVLYSTTAKNGGAYLSAAATCGGGYPGGGGGCEIRVNTTNQVNIDYLAPDLQVGTGATNVGTGADLLVTLVFDVRTDAADGDATLTLSQEAPGTIVAVAGGQIITATLTPDGDVLPVPETAFIRLPEPGVAGLSLAALLTVGGLRARSRKQS